MARKRPPNKVHTSPERAGIQNMENVKLPPDTEKIMPRLMGIMEQGNKNRQAYKGLWTTEQLEGCINDFFQYCYSCDYKPTPSGLCIWLGITKQQFWNWRTDSKYGDKFEIANRACEIMENYLEANIDKYPTGSMFLLRTSHGFVEQSKLDITTSQPASADEVAEMVKKIGLDKQGK